MDPKEINPALMSAHDLAEMARKGVQHLDPMPQDAPRQAPLFSSRPVRPDNPYRASSATPHNTAPPPPASPATTTGNTKPIICLFPGCTRDNTKPFKKLGTLYRHYRETHGLKDGQDKNYQPPADPAQRETTQDIVSQPMEVDMEQYTGQQQTEEDVEMTENPNLPENVGYMTFDQQAIDADIARFPLDDDIAAMPDDPAYLKSEIQWRREWEGVLMDHIKRFEETEKRLLEELDALKSA